jgi:FlaA1/EpsC-like NDP-sugar epimerase
MKSILDLSRFHKQMIAATADLFLLPITFCIAILLRYDSVTLSLFANYLYLIIAVPLISLPIFVRLGLYRAVIRFIDQKIIYSVVIGVTISVALLVALAAFTTHMNGMSRGVFGIYWISAIAYMVASRFLVRGFLLHPGRQQGMVRVAIYGAGKAGTQLASALRAGHEYLPVAFIDDSKELRGITIAGMKVYSSADLPNVITRTRISEILLAMPSISKSQQKRLLDKLEPLKVHIKVTPPVESLVSGELRLQDIRNIEIEDLLGRDQVAPEPALISACITGKCVLVSGAGGSIGSELCRQIIALKPTRLILLEMSEFALYSIKQELRNIKSTHALQVELVPFLGSVLDREKCTRIMTTYAVDTVYHAAAYKHVPLVEHNPIEGIRNNVFGTLSIAQAAIDSGVQCFVLISTDKAVRPTNVMGTTKRLAELILQAFARNQKATRFCMVRFGNVLGSSGSVVPLFRKQIEAGGPITLTHPEITRYFMTIPEAAQLVLQAGAMGEGGDVFVLDMGDPVKISDLAERMIHLSGLEVRSKTSPDGIAIEHVGLRPGEKLYEELLIGDNVEGTSHPLIMRAQESEIAWQTLQGMLNEMDQACKKFDYEAVRASLLSIIKEYSPQCGIEDFIWTEQARLNQSKGSEHKPVDAYL